MKRVVVVDDNSLTLPGFMQAVRGAPDLDLVAGLDHDQALAWEGNWAEVDVVVLDAADEGRTGDQFPGVAVVGRVRSAAALRQPLIVVVTGHYLHDGLRHRMAAAGADFYFLRSDLRSPEALVEVILHPERHRRGVPKVKDGATRRRLGVGPDSDVEGFVGWAEAHHAGPAFAGPSQSRDNPRARRWVRFRQAAADAGTIAPMNLTTGSAPLGQDAPSIRQLSRLWEWAARIRRPDC